MVFSTVKRERDRDQEGYWGKLLRGITTTIKSYPTIMDHTTPFGTVESQSLGILFSPRSPLTASSNVVFGLQCC